MRGRRWRVGLIVAVLVVLVGLVSAVVVRGQIDGHQAAAEASSFNSTESSMPAPTDTRPVVTVIGDNLSSPAQLGTPTTVWPVLVARALDARVISLSSAGSGYTSKTTSTSFGGTFVARAQQADSASRAVILFGGANDTQASKSAFERAVKRAFAEAQKAAPTAQIIVVGPAWPTAHPPQRLQAVRNTLHSIADSEKLTWVDPIADGWLDGKGLVQSDNATLRAKGEQAVASRIEAALKPVLD